MATRTSGQAVALTGLSVMVMMTFSHAMNDMWTSLLSPLLPSISDTYQVSIGQTGILVAILSFAGSMLQPLLGAVGDYVDRRWLAAFGPVLTAVGLTLIGYMPNFFMLGALIMLGGLGSAIFHPAGAAYIAMGANPNQRGLFVSIFSAGGTLGMAFGPLIVAQFDLNSLPYLLPAGMLIGIVTFLLIPSAAQNRSQPKTLRDYISVFQGPLRWLWFMSVLRSLSSVSYSSLLGFMLRDRFDQALADAHVGPTLAVYNIASAVGGIVGGRISDRIGRTVVLRSSILSTIPLFIGLVLSSPLDWWYYPLTAVVGAMVMANIPVSIVTAQEYAPQHIATASAMMMGFAWGTSGVLYPIIGSLADLTSPTWAMIAAIGLLLPAFFITVRLPEPERTTTIG
ncbi:MFS transporter [Herpetosiphon geysericola]|uniref:Fosmidomycin resistance protein n=1 Tax=Herpetosiphon geysericola TaxID=70996 RepID=A0A0P6XZ53_9CHLR|nr:MFS transporter [Herpetosiphon geysericola]KPL81701.1 fosmidomycin resistance protein [Herpetosiphon geysericola]